MLSKCQLNVKKSIRSLLREWLIRKIEVRVRREYKKEIQIDTDPDVRSPHAVETYNYTHYYYYDNTTTDNNYIKTLVEGPDNSDSYLGPGFTCTYTYLSKPVE